MIAKIIEEIKQENEWREKDFSKIKYIYYQLSDENQVLFLRMSIPYIYAHWEGFVIDSLKKILDHFNQLKLQHHQVKINIFVLSLQEKFDYLKGKQSFEQKCQFSENFLRFLNEQLKFDKHINTQANLNFDVLKDLCQLFGLNVDKFAQYRAKINKLVNIRNHIAHGENSYILSLENIEEYINLVNELILRLAEELEEYLQQEKYLKSG